MSETRKITTFGVLLAAEFLTFLVVLPSLAPDIPSNFWQFLAAFSAVLIVYTALVFGWLGKLIRSRKP